MPEQQKDVQSQKQKLPPNLSGGADKDAAGKPGMKQDPKKAGTKDDDEDSDSSCGTGTCG